MKRILLCSVLTKPYYSGSGINMFSFAKTLRKLNNNVSILSFNWNVKNPIFETIEDLKIIRIPACTIKVVNVLLVILSLPYILIHTMRFEIIIIYGPFIPQFMLIAMFAKTLGIKVVFQSVNLSMDDVDSMLNKNLVISKINKKILKGISLYHAINKTFAEKYLCNFPEYSSKVFLSSQGVDTTRFKPADYQEKIRLRAKHNICAQKKVILSVGNLINRKGYGEIFEVLSILPIDYLYIIVGNYSNNKYFYWQSPKEMFGLYQKGKVMLGDKVWFMGAIENVEDVITIADVLLMNSEREGLPNCLLEAMASKLPCVFKSLEGVDDMLGVNGHNYISFKDNKGMLIGLTDMLSKPEQSREIAENAYQEMMENHSDLLVARRLLAKLDDDK